jgi:hypothetical protein
MVTVFGAISAGTRLQEKMIKGLDELQRNLRDLADRAHRLGGQHKVRFDDLFPTDFVRRFTDFLTLDELFAASGFTIESTDDFEKIPADAWDAFIAKNTLFANWEEMQRKALAEWTARKLRLGE